jgi:hypothetical protein
LPPVIKISALVLGTRKTVGLKWNCDGEDEIDEAIVRIAGADVGQGHHTVMGTNCCRSAGVLILSGLQLETSDTALTRQFW